MVLMRKVRAVTAGVLAALWVVAGSHCLLEQVSAFGFLRCEAAGAANSAPASHCGDAACLTLESGQYASAVQVKAPLAVLGLLVLDLSLISEEPQPADLSGGVLTGAPPDLPRIWQFASRAAVPPRAPPPVA
jgi:hypothetical protein